MVKWKNSNNNKKEMQHKANGTPTWLYYVGFFHGEQRILGWKLSLPIEAYVIFIEKSFSLLYSV